MKFCLLGFARDLHCGIGFPMLVISRKQRKCPEPWLKDCAESTGSGCPAVQLDSCEMNAINAAVLPRLAPSYRLDLLGCHG